MLDGKQIKDASITKAKLALVDPVASSDPATKSWVQAQIDGAVYNQDWKASVRVASVTNVTISNPATSVFDGVTLSSGDRILLKNQTAGAENGIYVFNGSGVAMTRAIDFDANTEVTAGAAIPVEEGSTLADTYWKLTTNNPISLGTTALVFANFAPATSAPVPTTSNKYMTAVVTTANGDVACNTAIASTPTNDGFVLVLINADNPELGDGVKTKDCYFSGDSGVTARAFVDITTGDKLYWNGSIAGYQLAATDKVTFQYTV